MKKKLLAKIFIPIIALGILVAPISPILKFENNKVALETKAKKAEASMGCGFTIGEITIENKTSDGVSMSFPLAVSRPAEDTNGSGGISMSTTTNYILSGSAAVDVVGFISNFIAGGCPDALAMDFEANTWDSTVGGDALGIDEIQKGPDGKFRLPDGIMVVEVRDPSTGDIITKADGTDLVVSFNPDLTLPNQDVKATISGLTKNTNYLLRVRLNFLPLLVADATRDKEFTTSDDSSTSGGTSTGSVNTGEEPGYSLVCNLFDIQNVVAGVTGALFLSDINWIGCLGQLTYTLWTVAAKMAHLAGSLLDFFVYYSTNSDSYTSPFLTIAWGTIRDVANIFFIIALLYVAIKTILNLNVSNNKRIIGAIVIAALLINFSFFITEVVIDASNILAKVFYNQIIPDKNTETNITGQSSITSQLVTNLNPKSIVSENVYKAPGGSGATTFVFVAWLALGITLYMAWIFLKVAFIFIARVISLWLCIIFSPFAFASYSLPFKIPGIGNQDWWNMLVKNAFLAPIFIFFLYVTVLFTKSFPQTIVYTYTGLDTPGVMNSIMKSLIPILLCFVLLTKGKNLAIEWSGEMGKSVNKMAGFATGTIGVKYVGGFLASKVGAVGRGTVGKLGNKMANSTGLAKTGFGRMIAGWGKKASESSFDIRGAGGYQKALGAMGMGAYGGKPGGQGGYKKAEEERSRKRMEAAKKMTPKADTPEVKALMNSEKDLQGLLMKVSSVLEKLDKRKTVAEKGANQAKHDALYLEREGKRYSEEYEKLRTKPKKTKDDNDKMKAMETAGTHQTEAYNRASEDEGMYRGQIRAFTEQIKAIKDGKDVNDETNNKELYDVTYQKRNEKGELETKAIRNETEGLDYSTLNAGKDENGNIRTISQLENTEIYERKKAVRLLKAKNLATLADSYNTKFNRLLYGENAVLEDSHKIRMDEKLDSGKTT